MKRTDMLREIKNALQREEELREETPIAELKEWDSMIIISLISMYDSLFSINMTYNELTKVVTVKDLIDKVKDKLDQS